jgi:hypothetical protein
MTQIGYPLMSCLAGEKFTAITDLGALGKFEMRAGLPLLRLPAAF